jgi:hypothetical protein
MATEIHVIFSDFHPSELVEMFPCFGDDLCARHQDVNLLSRHTLMITKNMLSELAKLLILHCRATEMSQLFTSADESHLDNFSWNQMTSMMTDDCNSNVIHRL